MSGFGAMAWNGFREARRNRVTVVVAAFALVLLGSSVLVTEVTVSTMERVLADFGLSSMALILVFLAVFLSSGLLSRELERRTIYMMVSKPMSRGAFLVARLAGNMITLGALLVAMTAVFVLELKLYGAPVRPVYLWAAAGLWFELFVLTCAGFLFSSFASQTVSALATVGLFIAGHLSRDIVGLARRSASSGLRTLGEGVYYLLPNLERVNFRPQAAHALDVAPGEFVLGAAYSLAYGAVLAALAVIIFTRRDFR